MCIPTLCLMFKKNLWLFYTKNPFLICILDPGNLKCATFLVWMHIFKCIDMKQPFTPNLKGAHTITYV